ncbi:MAG: hypothetical protein ACI9UN_004338 [Granulosicoccus sp.]|jgi:hypothetical protein
MKYHNLLELFTAVSFINVDKMLRGLSIFFLIVLNFISTQTSAQENEYLDINRERVNSALRPRASMPVVKLAEASLTGLGWLTLYGSDDNSFQLAQELNQIFFDRYNGTDMSEIMTSRTSEAYFEMLNLNRFANTSCSSFRLH